MRCAYDSACSRQTAGQTFRASSRRAERVVWRLNRHSSSATTATPQCWNSDVRAGSPASGSGAAAYGDQALRDEAICSQLSHHDVDVVLLLGYMRKLGPATLGCFRNRILNTHPALLPKHGGKSKHGIHVHESVLASGDTETGVSIHLVDGEYDQGQIIAQCRVSVLNSDTPATLQARVLAREHEFLVETLKMIVAGSIRLT